MSLLRRFFKLTINNRTTVIGNVIVSRRLSFGSIKDAMQNYFLSQVTVPYTHACQVGDPVLRSPAQYVEPEIIDTRTFQKLIVRLVDVMRSYDAMGLAANQVGLSYQIFVAEVNKSHVEAFNKDYREAQKIEEMPLKVFINPKMKILDYTRMIDTEECLSIMGFSAVIPRASSVEVEALDPTGKPFTLRAEGFLARIVQHEMDHLQGKLFIDRMDSKTFACVNWSDVNMKRGNVRMRFHPRSWLRRITDY